MNAKWSSLPIMGDLGLILVAPIFPLRTNSLVYFVFTLTVEDYYGVIIAESEVLRQRWANKKKLKDESNTV